MGGQLLDDKLVAVGIINSPPYIGNIARVPGDDKIAVGKSGCGRGNGIGNIVDRNFRTNSLPVGIVALPVNTRSICTIMPEDGKSTIRQCHGFRLLLIVDGHRVDAELPASFLACSAVAL